MECLRCGGDRIKSPDAPFCHHCAAVLRRGKPIMIMGFEYPSISEASRESGISVSAIKHRLMVNKADYKITGRDPIAVARSYFK